MDLLSQWFDSLLDLPNETLAAALAGLSFLLFAGLAVSWFRAVQARRAARKTGNVIAFKKRQRHRTGKAQIRVPGWSRQLAPVSLIALAGVFVLWFGFEGDRSVIGSSSLRGFVTHVRDGDTIEVANVPVRIANLDCAEMFTAEGRVARERMAQLVRGQQLACDLEGRMSYDREVGTCALISSGEDIGETLIREGICGRW
ncbi:thermonuclease family protein [Loktanella sp. DJP18]|uniref:thermonuclease family protein n=1 Tax=Loktanella sp. DJP18 TaxID=3409788 RepID=UPI003BB77B4D